MLSAFLLSQACSLGDCGRLGYIDSIGTHDGNDVVNTGVADIALGQGADVVAHNGAG
jgi:hypothetical protein